MLVHQFDAHAWVEYWTAGAGWTRVDPTFQVAPERIENGLEQAVTQEQSFLQDSPFSPCVTATSAGSTSCAWPGTG